MSNYEQIIKQYYDLVDRQDWGAIAELFSDDIKYNRAGRLISGKEMLVDFYKKERGIKGKHVLDNVFYLTDPRLVVAAGGFVFDDSEKLGFADFFYFNNENLINRRETYLAIGFEKIND